MIHTILFKPFRRYFVPPCCSIHILFAAFNPLPRVSVLEGHSYDMRVLEIQYAVELYSLKRLRILHSTMVA